MRDTPNIDAAVRATAACWAVAQQIPVSTATRFVETHRAWIDATTARLERGEVLTTVTVLKAKPASPPRPPRAPVPTAPLTVPDRDRQAPAPLAGTRYRGVSGLGPAARID
jgi:hypothetical protein